jgi:eukaryotic-like serine/threonine-protein kinase
VFAGPQPFFAAMSSTPTLPGSIIQGRYEIQRRLGSGGMGAVYLARHVTLKREVAIKFIHPELCSSDEVLRRFDTEAKAAARIKSRHAVSVIDHGVADNGQPYIVMEYLEGESLEQALKRRGRLPFDEVVEIVAQIARALEQAHEAGIVHRDLKPDNVFLAKDGDKGTVVKVLDFGIAKVVHDDAVGGVGTTKTGMVLGTPLFMSPEALTASAPVSPASDIWSLGACTFAAAVGKVPFYGEAIGDVVLKVCAAPMPVPSDFVPELPKAFDEWFAKACSRDMATRFKRVGEMADALRRLDEWSAAQRDRVTYEIRPLASMVDLEPADMPSSSGRGLLLAGGLAGVALTLGALGYFVLQRTRAADETARAAAASAAAVIEAENERKLREAERHFWGSQADAGPSAGTGAASPTKAGPRKRRPAAAASAAPSAPAPSGATPETPAPAPRADPSAL